MNTDELILAELKTLNSNMKLLLCAQKLQAATWAAKQKVNAEFDQKLQAAIMHPVGQSMSV